MFVAPWTADVVQQQITTSILLNALGSRALELLPLTRQTFSAKHDISILERGRLVYVGETTNVEAVSKSPTTETRRPAPARLTSTVRRF
jgi:uncharacterized hydantoinase/oxoprolinase family protein